MEMDESQVQDSSIQVGIPIKKITQPVKKPGNIYQNRRDCLALKKRLMKYVNQEEYTKTLVAYFHGVISKTVYDEKMKLILNHPFAKILHNQLMRSILFNAHFSMEQPPNISDLFSKSTKNSNEKSFNNEINPLHPQISVQVHNIKPILSLFNSLTASDLRKIPSQNQFSLRIENIAFEKKLTAVDPQSVEMIYYELKKYLLLLLHFGVNIQRKKQQTDNSHEPILSDITINAGEILQIVKTNDYFSSIVSMSLLSRYSSLLNPQ